MNTILEDATDSAGLDGIAPARAIARPQHAEPQSEAEVAVTECPLHTAMRQVAEAAVTQHVLYAEGVYRARDGLLREMQIWLRLHELVRSSICPATRTGSALEPSELEIALAGLPPEMRAKVGATIHVCGRRPRGEGCPLAAEPQEALFN